MRVDTQEGTVSISLRKQRFILLPEKAIFWPEEKSLIVSDIHLGKAGHFRKHGLAVPANVHFGDLMKLEELLHKYHITKVIFLGDLFHSEMNVEWEIFSDWIGRYPNIRFILVEGNHDILPQSTYTSLGFELFEALIIGELSLTHEEKISESHYNISGHIHPGIRLRGRGKQGLTVPCFYFKPTHAYMPAFGFFTGVHPLKKSKNDKVFGVANGQVIGLNSIQ